MTPYDHFRNRVLQKAEAARVPIVGSIELTARCNLSCGHCYINLPLSDAPAAKRELATDKWCSIIDQVVDAGCVWLLFTGGEVFIRPDFLRIYEHAYKKGQLIEVFTNGTALTPEMADYLRDLKPLKVEISVYGATRETHDLVTGVQGSFDRCMRGIGMLLSRGIPLELKTAVTKVNVRELAGMKALAQTLGVRFRFDPLLNVRLDGGRGPDELRISPEEVFELDIEDSVRADHLERLCTSPRVQGTDTDRLYRCGAGITTFHIDPYGIVYPCMMSRHSGHSLADGCFLDGWEGILRRTVSAERTKSTPCDTCSIEFLCSQCPGWSLVEHHDPEKPVDFLCRVAHTRAVKLGVDHGMRSGEGHRTP